MIHITKLWYQCMNANGIDIHRPNGSGDYLFLFLRCPTEIYFHGAYELVPENSFFLYEKGQPQIYRKTDGNFFNDWIHFDFDHYDGFFEELGIPFHTPMALGNSDPITDMISDLFIEFFDAGRHHTLILDQKIRTLFYKFSDLYQLSPSGGSNPLKYSQALKKIRKMIKDHIYLPESADELAITLGISTSYLQHIYKDCFDVTLQQDIIEGRIHRACCLLEHTSYTIGEIAVLCSYNTAEHFSRQFRKWKGCSPMQYRQNYISNRKENSENERGKN